MTVATETVLFNWRISVIDAQAKAIEGYAWVFDSLGNYDTALEKLDLRLSAKRLREAADRLDNIERQIKGSATSFPDLQAAE